MLVRLLVEGNIKQLEIVSYLDGHLGWEALLAIRKVQPDLFASLSPVLPAVSASSLSLFFYSVCPPSYIRAAAAVVPSSADTNWHAQFSTGTFNPKDQAYRKSSFISSPFGNCLCSLQGALGGFPHKGPMQLVSSPLPGCKRKNLILQRQKKNPWGQLGFQIITVSRWNSNEKQYFKSLIPCLCFCIWYKDKDQNTSSLIISYKLRRLFQLKTAYPHLYFFP